MFPSVGVELSVGDSFRYVGPTGSWRRGAGRWVPMAWSSHPGDAQSYRIIRSELCINFMNTFVILELHDSAKQITARVRVEDRDVWMKLAHKSSRGLTWWVEKVVTEES